MKKNRSQARDIMLSTLSILGLIVVWFLVSNSKPDFFPTPMATIERFIKLIEKPVMKISILGHIFASLKRVMLALIAAIILGVGIGLVMGWNKKVRAAINPILMALRPIPPIAWIPLIILLFGIGEFPKVLHVFIGAFPDCYEHYVRCFTGRRYVSEGWKDLQGQYRADAEACGISCSYAGDSGGYQDRYQFWMDGSGSGRNAVQ